MKVTIYMLVDPRLKQPEERCRYVGRTSKTLNTRLKKHIYESKLGMETYKHRWIRKLLREDVTPEIEEIEITTDDESSDREKYWIAHFRKEGYKLTNCTDGGDGAYGYVASEETRQKLRDMWKNWSEEKKKDMSDKKRKAMTGLKRSEENKRNMSLCRKGKPNGRAGDKHPLFGKRGKDSPNYGKKHSAETIERLRECHKGYRHTDEAKKKMALATARIPRDARGRFMKIEKREV